MEHLRSKVFFDNKKFAIFGSLFEVLNIVSAILNFFQMPVLRGKKYSPDC